MPARKIVTISVVVVIALLLPWVVRAEEMKVDDHDWFEEKQLLDKPLRKLEDNIVRLTDRRFTLRWGFFNQDIFTYASEGAVQGISGPTDVRTNFWVRRARLYLRGTIIDDRIQWYFAPELNPPNRDVVTKAVQDETGAITGYGITRTTGGFIRDACMTLRFIPYMAITLGQTKTPFGLEGVESLGVNPTILRSFTTMYLHWYTLRDIGVWAAGGWKARQHPFSIDYNVCLVNGGGMNKSDNNGHKDFVGRIRVQPFVPGLTLAVCGYKGRETFQNTSIVLDPGSVGDGKNTTFIGEDGLTLSKWKWAFYFDYYCPFLRGFNARGEYIREELSGDASGFGGPRDAKYGAQGGYVLARYRYGPWEPLYRFEAFDPDTRVGGDTLKVHTWGLNYYFVGWTHIAINYQWVQNFDELEPLISGGRQFFLTRFRKWFPVNQNNVNVMFSLRF